jgi:putative serine protease PepD
MTGKANGSGRPRTWRLAAAAAVIALVAGILGGIVGAFLRPGSPNATTAPGPAATACDVTNVAARVLPSIVTINVSGPAAGTGSGSVLDSQGNILTNNHVIEAAATRGSITVDFARGQSGVPATIVGRDPGTDLAVIRAQRTSGSLTPVQLANSADLVVGQPVVAAGSPLGLSSTITSGIVSALSRYVNVGQGDQPSVLVNAVQTDAAINPGNSGGPLTDCSGRQIGVNSAGAQVPSAGAAGGGSIGLNFAIPIDFAKSVANQIIQTGSVTHPTIGVLGVTVTDEISRATGDPRGALVEQVVPGLGAASAGIRPGDVITRVGQSGVNSVDQMIVAVRNHRPGDAVEVTYATSGAQHTARVSVSGV